MESLFSIFKKLKSAGKRKPSRKNKFEQACREMEQRLGLWEKVPRLPRRGKQMGFLITSWQQTSVPFLSLEIASCIKNQGYEVTLVFDLVDLGLRADDQFSIERKALLGMISRCERYFNVVLMDEQTDAGTEKASDDAFIKSLVFENVCAVLRGETAAKKFISDNPSLLLKWKQHLAKTRRVLSAQAASWSWMFVPGGIYSVSGIYLHVLQELHLSFFTYDSGEGLFAVCRNGVTSYLGEIPDAVRTLESELTEAEWKAVEAETSRQLETRWQGKDTYVRQSPPQAQENQKDKSDLLLFLNCRADNAAMARQLAFENVEDWIRQVVAWSLKKKLKLIVRQHPSERSAVFRGSDAYDAIIKSVDPEGKAATFVAAHDPVNSYTLIEHTKVVLPYTSRVGVEAAMLGRPVILGSKCYYESMKFSRQAQDPEAYFALIEHALRDPIPPNPQFQRQARLIYFLIEKCFWLHTVLTPVPSDCRIWIKQPPQSLWAAPEQQDLLEVLLGQRSLFEVLFRHHLKRKTSP